MGLALHHAVEDWRSGNRERELRLHLLFLSWYCTLEPPHLTGYQEARSTPRALASLFQEVFLSFDDDVLDDAEFLFVVGLMAQLAPWCMGETLTVWEERSQVYRQRYRQLAPQGLSADVFLGRGAYGDYFAGQVGVPGGF